ncbi:Riboflavin transporter FmnP [Oscillibacter sp. PC13]|uniref:ECF transporter S component n=1 Tax=Oscillibacter sp. PC13 TaxID=1855299 RepID=UPI0008EDA09E|nr:ECF transporter S component [Oscillibacter sp. PC13]SFP49042.1 Riboflavin transporter FmnP [Oscillibacter sp. PC13]
MKKLPITPLKRRVFIALLASIAMLCMLCFGISVIPGATYLKYEPSGGVILLCGLLLGPAGALECAIVKCILYFLVHGGSPYGHLSDLLATCVFAGCATFLLGRLRSASKVQMILCCFAGAVAATLVMIPANYVILHLQYGMDPAAVSSSMIYIIPYNLVKTGLNSVFALCLYHPVGQAIYKSIEARKEPYV